MLANNNAGFTGSAPSPIRTRTAVELPPQLSYRSHGNASRAIFITTYYAIRQPRHTI